MCGGRKGGKKGTKNGAATETYNKPNKNKSCKPNRSMDHSLMLPGENSRKQWGKHFSVNLSGKQRSLFAVSSPLNLCTLPPDVGWGEG